MSQFLTLIVVRSDNALTTQGRTFEKRGNGRARVIHVCVFVCECVEEREIERERERETFFFTSNL